MVSRDFLGDVSAGRADAAMARCTGNVSRKDLEPFTAYDRQKGTYRDFSISGVDFKFDNGNWRWTFNGKAQFDQGEKAVEIRLVKKAGVYKVDHATLE